MLKTVTKRYDYDFEFLDESHIPKRYLSGEEMMSTATSVPDLLHSALPRGEFEALLQRFVAGLPDRLRQLDAAIQQLNWDDVARLAHQIKGAGGSYGYPSIAEEASRIEQLALSQKSQELCSGPFLRLEVLCLSAQRALKETFHLCS